MRAPRSPTAWHNALAEQLVGEITTGRYAVGSRFPTEQELQDRFGVGRHTVREALKLLAEQGLVGRRRKTGTIVLSDQPVTPYVHSLRDLKGLLDFAQDTRLDIHHEGYASISERAPGNLFDVKGARWFRVAGIRYQQNDDKPLCWTEIYVPENLVPARATIHEQDTAIYQKVLEQYNLKLDYVEQEITATVLPRQFAKLLLADAEAAALMVGRRYVAHTGATFEVSYNLYPASRYSVRSVIRQRV